VSTEQQEESMDLASDQSVGGEQNTQQDAVTEPAGEARSDPPWPTNGGPLGCLIGTMTGLLLGAFLGTTLLIPYRFLGIVLTVVFTLGLAVAGWKIGRSIFREYTPPKPRRRFKKEEH
jgi:predicted lipid-binding transport protein (Tim44 family)